MLGKSKIVNATLVLVALAAPERGQAEANSGSSPDKGACTLFRPTPRDQLRSFETDRPDKTECPFTVDAGHFQIEMDLVTVALEQPGPVGGARQVGAWSLAAINLKLGLTDRLDVQVILEPWNVVHATSSSDRADATMRVSGYGDTTVRFKVNLWGNDGGPTAAALLPLLTVPAGRDGLASDHLSGGLVIPISIDLPHGFSLGLNAGAVVSRPQRPRATWSAEMVHSAALNHDLFGPLSAYVEFWSLVSTEAGVPWDGTVDFGFNLFLRENLKLDFGVNIGVTGVVPDWQPFLGLSARF